MSNLTITVDEATLKKARLRALTECDLKGIGYFTNKLCHIDLWAFKQLRFQ